jgi:transposase
MSQPVAAPVRRVELFTGAGRRRSWSAAEKAAIVAESYAEGETVCGVARRHGLTPQQLFTWRRLARRAFAAAPSPALFVPAVIDTLSPPAPAAEARPATRRRLSRRAAASGIELEIDGVVIRIGPDASPAAITAVIRALQADS